ncbi:MAG: hypothetical protein AXA67_00310 [Methylothermaceae bacteria B42]|nr:MAG: hypothetical protein AXA67_00310 [Methylothermaceae bacteria B42]HHJ38842.1 nucleotide exchange factor GrpE [Methylothermaceae bacterium]
MTTKEELLAAFEQFLEDDPGGMEAGPQVGLAQLFAELAALKTEVRTEARQFKSALENFTSVLESHEREREEYAKALKKAGEETLKPVLLELVDLRDRQAAGLKALEKLRPGFIKRLLFKRKRQLYESIYAGQSLTLDRFDQMLTSHGIQPVAAEGRPFDPNLMRVAEVVHRKKLEDGIVVSELRRGYLWHGKVLRLAEVKVNKL